MRVFGIWGSILYSEFARVAGGYKNVGFRSACIESNIVRISARLIATGSVLEVSALPNLQKLATAGGNLKAKQPFVDRPILIRHAAHNVEIWTLPCFGGR